jgi:hypothetical protein
MSLQEVKDAQLESERPSPLYNMASNVATGARKGLEALAAPIGLMETAANLPFYGIGLLADYLSGGKLGLKKMMASGMSDIGKTPLNEVTDRLPAFFHKEPEGIGEYATQRGIEFLPYLMRGGMPTPQELKRFLVGTGSATAAYGLGGGPLAQNISQLLGEGAYSYNTRPTMGQMAASKYNIAGPSGPKGVEIPRIGGAEQIKSLANDINRLADTEIDTSSRKLLKNTANALHSTRVEIAPPKKLWFEPTDVEKPIPVFNYETDPGKLVAVRQSMSKIYPDLKKAGHEAITNKTLDEINDILFSHDTKMKNNTFWEGLSEGEKIEIANKGTSRMAQTINDALDNVPKLPANAERVVNLIKPIVSSGGKLSHWIQDPISNKYFKDLFSLTQYGGKSDFIKYINNMGRHMYSEENKPKESFMSQMKEVPGAIFEPGNPAQ